MIRILGLTRIYLLRVTLSVFLRVLSFFVKFDRKLIIFASFNGASYSDNPRYLFENLRDNPDFSDYRFVWAFKTVRVLDGATVVRFNSLRYYYYLTKAKYWIFNAKMAPYYYKKPEQIYLQTWHGTPLKHLAHDLQDNGQTYYRSQQSYQQMLNSYDHDSRHWDYLIAPNEFSSQAFQTAFQIAPAKLLKTGYPRLDGLVNASPAQITALKQKWRLPLDKKIVLYAPTWRDNSYSLAGYQFKLQVDFAKWHRVLGDETLIIFKPHYLIANTITIPPELADFVIQIPAKFDINEIYLLSDSLVTDYSSVFFDYALLNRPIYFYMYDFNEYKDQLRGFYLKVPDDLPNDISYTEDDLLANLKNQNFDAERLKEFNQRFNSWQDGQSATKIIKKLFPN